MKTLLAMATVAVTLSASPSAFADFIYTYSGNPFDESSGAAVGTPTNMQITLDFGQQALPPGITVNLATASGVNWTINDGFTSYAFAGGQCGGSAPCTVSQASVTTNASGQITSWIFEITSPGGVGNNPHTFATI